MILILMTTVTLGAVKLLQYLKMLLAFRKSTKQAKSILAAVPHGKIFGIDLF